MIANGRFFPTEKGFNCCSWQKESPSNIGQFEELALLMKSGSAAAGGDFSTR
jgi:hypothetical protein